MRRIGQDWRPGSEMGEIERGGGGGLGSGCGLIGSARLRGASVRERKRADIVMVVMAVVGGRIREYKSGYAIE